MIYPEIFKFYICKIIITFSSIYYYCRILFIFSKTILSMVSRVLICTISKNHCLEICDIPPMHDNCLERRIMLYFFILKQLSSISIISYLYHFIIFTFINNNFYKIQTLLMNL
ncbi:hypothetical protein SLOPH_799 [Spraguea lophii 42_110]|uniref:Uncharacterized protein n=1 Tax=Spraguea lophii (strain 42_110) TaxID=1358809 RepID=S7W7F2_SPRLO|nr:hypothetical protein SLOPH_799 [Spraguea lophii 42_110]